jgi:hypothetical protein
MGGEVITRLLPREEWARLAGTELETVYPVLPQGSHVIVIEDDGRIVGCWAVYPQWHVHGSGSRSRTGSARAFLDASCGRCGPLHRRSARKPS